jgi:hypothetical protein
LITRDGRLAPPVKLAGNYLCLVRPDGHLGLVEHPVQMEGLKNYLAMLCSPEQVESELANLAP